jgi:hypothetical protein
LRPKRLARYIADHSKTIGGARLFIVDSDIGKGDYLGATSVLCGDQVFGPFAAVRAGSNILSLSDLYLFGVGDDKCW